MLDECYLTRMTSAEIHTWGQASLKKKPEKKRRGGTRLKKIQAAYVLEMKNKKKKRCV